MIRLLFVGDGERDAETVPPIVERLLDIQVDDKTRRWARLHNAKKRKGYDRKLGFALRLARDMCADGLVATVDRDTDKKRRRLRQLQNGRATDRKQAPPLPTALGEADPHGEAWLLDDPVAVREAMSLPQEIKIPAVRETKNPKAVLTELLKKSPREDKQSRRYLTDIAQRLNVQQCAHAKETGFHAFAEDVRVEIGPVATQSKD